MESMSQKDWIIAIIFGIIYHITQHKRCMTLHWDKKYEKVDIALNAQI